MPPLPVLKLRLRKKRMSSIGSSVCNSHKHEDRQHDERDPERGEGLRRGPSLLGRLDESEHE